MGEYLIPFIFVVTVPSAFIIGVLFALNETAKNSQKQIAVNTPIDIEQLCRRIELGYFSFAPVMTEDKNMNYEVYLTSEQFYLVMLTKGNTFNRSPKDNLAYSLDGQSWKYFNISDSHRKNINDAILTHAKASVEEAFDKMDKKFTEKLTKMLENTGMEIVKKV